VALTVSSHAQLDQFNGSRLAVAGKSSAVSSLVADKNTIRVFAIMALNKRTLTSILLPIVQGLPESGWSK